MTFSSILSFSHSLSPFSYINRQKPSRIHSSWQSMVRLVSSLTTTVPPPPSPKPSPLSLRSPCLLLINTMKAMKACLPSINYLFLLQHVKPCPAVAGEHALCLCQQTKHEAPYNPMDAGDTASSFSETDGGPTQSLLTAKEHLAGYSAKSSLKRAVVSHAEYPNVATIDMCQGKVLALAISGDLLYSASDRKDIRVFQTPLFEEVDCFGSSSAAAQALTAFDEVIYSAHEDNKIRVWHRVWGEAANSGMCKHKLVAVLPKFEQCMKSMLSKRNYVQVRRHRSKLWIEHADRISALALGSSASGRGHDVSGSRYTPPSVLYSASWDKTVKVWSLHNFKCTESFHAHHDAINAMVVIDGSVLVTASADCTIKLWRKKRKANRHVHVDTLEGHKAAVNALAVSKNFKVLYSGGADGTLIVWKRASSCCKTLQAVIRGSASGKVFVSGSLSAELNIQKGSSLGSGRSTANQSSLSSSTASSGNLGGEVLSACSLGTTISATIGQEMITVANSVTNKIVRRMILSAKCREAMSISKKLDYIKKAVLVGHARAVLSVSTVGDDAVCSSSTDKTIRVWCRQNIKGKGTWVYACVAVLTGHEGPVKTITSVQCPGGQQQLQGYRAGSRTSTNVSARHTQALLRHGSGAATAASGSCTYEHEDEDDDRSSRRGTRGRSMYAYAHLQDVDDPRRVDAHAASTRAVSSEREGDQRIIVYSAGLDAKVRMWAVNISR